MKQKFKKSVVTLLSIACFVSATGCGAVKFKTPDEAKVAQKINEEANNKMPANLEVTSLVYDNELALPTGAVTAKYHAELPQFSETGEKSGIIKKINNYYTDELESLKQDCQSYFDQVRTAYGSLWDSSIEPASNYGVRHTYEIIDKNAQRISVARTYKYTDVNMQLKYVYSAETFDCATGWPIKLNDVLIADTAKVNDVIRNKITKWAADNLVDVNLLAEFDISKNEYSFALNDESIYLCIDENGVSSVSPGAYLIKIPTSEISEILVKTK